MSRLTKLFLLWLVLVITGCASVPMASIEEDIKAKSFATPANKASLYIYRNENFGGAIPLSVAVNGRVLGQTAAMTYFKLDVLPGKYTIESYAENVSTLNVSAEAGNNYYIWQEVKMGMWMARSLLQQVDEATGTAAVKQCKLAATTLQVDEIRPIESSGNAQPGNSTAQKLRELELMKKDGLITDEEYQTKRAKTLEGL